MTKRPSAEDLAEVAAGKGSARDRAEAAAYRSKTRASLRRGKGGMTKRRKVKRPKRQG